MNDGRKKKPQKHQNKTAYKIKFDTLALDIQKKVSLNLLCKRCVEQINWKLQFNKYKKITQPGKCNFCHQKNVTRSYMKSCDACAEKETVCPKCLGKDLELPEEDALKLSQKQQTLKDKQEEKALNEFVDSLKERSRRKVRRQYEKGIITWDNQDKLFRDLDGNQLIGLKFKNKGLTDLEREMDEDFDDDNEEQDMIQDDSEDDKGNHKIKQGKKQKLGSPGEDKLDSDGQCCDQDKEGSDRSEKDEEGEDSENIEDGDEPDIDEDEQGEKKQKGEQK